MSLQLLAHRHARSGERVADGLLRYAEAFSDLLLLEVLAEVQLHDLLLAIREDAYVVENGPSHDDSLVEAREILVVNPSCFHARELCFHVRADLQAGPS